MMWGGPVAPSLEPPDSKQLKKSGGARLGCTYPEICMVGVLGCEGSDDVHMERWGSSRGGG